MNLSQLIVLLDSYFPVLPWISFAIKRVLRHYETAYLFYRQRMTPFCEASWQVLHYRQSLDQAVSADIFKLQPMKPHALHVAAFWGFAGFIDRSYSYHRGFSPVDSNGWTPLHWAASMGNEESVATLVKLGVDIGETDSNGWTPLTFAVVKGHYHIVKLLLKCGTNPEQNRLDGILDRAMGFNLFA